MQTSDRKSFDVVIAGAGPAGSSLAIRLANFGLSVRLLEQKTFPREKLCGEFISPECLSHLKELGVYANIFEADASPLRETVFYSRNGKGVSIRSDWLSNAESNALGLSRAKMDLLLIERARFVGVEVSEGTVVGSLIEENGRIIGVKAKDTAGQTGEIYAGLIVDATGRTRSLARRLRSRKESVRPASHVAFKTHMRHASLQDGACEIYVYRNGYGGCNRVENDLYNLCFIVSAEDTKRLASDAEKILHEIVFNNGRAREVMQSAVVVKPWLAVPIERFGRGELVPAAGLITVGDAAAFIDPFTGSGILVALESAKIAAAAITKHCKDAFDLSKMADAYKRNYATAFNSRLRLCSWLRGVAFVPILAESTLALISLNSRIRQHLARATRFKPDRRS